MTGKRYKRRRPSWASVAATAEALAIIGLLAQGNAPAEATEPEKGPEVFEYYGQLYKEELDTDGYVGLVPITPAVDPLEAEKIALAKTVWGEARGCTIEGQQNVVWTILNRYDHGGFGETIIDVIEAPHQFVGYRESNPVDADIMSTVEGVVNSWLDGNPGPDYLYFHGDGRENHFSRTWRGE